MIKKIAYITFLAMMAILATNLFLTHSLASDGEYLGDLYTKLLKKQETVGELRRKIMETQSISVIENKAVMLGFSESVQSRLLTVKTADPQLSQRP